MIHYFWMNQIVWTTFLWVGRVELGRGNWSGTMHRYELHALWWWDTYKILLFLQAGRFEVLIIAQLGCLFLTESTKTIIIAEFMGGCQSKSTYGWEGTIKFRCQDGVTQTIQLSEVLGRWNNLHIRIVIKWLSILLVGYIVSRGDRFTTIPLSFNLYQDFFGYTCEQLSEGVHLVGILRIDLTKLIEHKCIGAWWWWCTPKYL